MFGRARVAALTAALGLAAAALASGRASAQNGDPRLRWRTIETRHFAIHYHEPLGVVARRVAVVAERAHAVLSDALDNHPDEQIQIVLSDDTDFANGSASALPIDNIRLYATGPEDFSSLGDYDDWLTELVTHEHTHILHLDQIGGIPAIINAIFGKVYAPNHVLPRWFLEGFAVYEESTHTSGGRLRSTYFDMWMRMEVLEDELLSIDQVSTSVDRWPHGNVAYLYGSRFVEFIARRHGQRALTKMAHDYGRQVLPYAVNRMTRRATGRTMVELYDDFTEEITRRYRAQRDEVRARGVREGTRITFHGEEARSPRWLPDGRIAYFTSLPDDHSQIRILDPDRGTAGEVMRTTGNPSIGVHPNGRVLVWNGIGAHLETYFFNDLYASDLETGETTRLTEGLRAMEPDVSPDGRSVAFTVNGAGTTHLMIARLSDVAGTMRVLFRSERFGQVYTPRWSPDGRTIAASTWRPGGLRDVALVDVESGATRWLMEDRAQDSGPTWSPDGSTLYFASDRTGISNVYAYELASRTLHQVTNVVAGAYQPAVSADGRELAYVGYTSRGFDLWRMPLDRAEWLAAPPYVDDRPEPPDHLGRIATLRSEAYEPLETILPRAYLLSWGPDAFGDALGITFTGGDIVGFHQYGGRVGVGLVRGDVGFDLAYAYTRPRTPIRGRLFRAVSPRGGLFVSGEQRIWIEDAWGGDLSTSYVFRHAHHFEVVDVGYTLAHISPLEPFGGALDPNEPPPIVPETGWFSGVRAGWTWSNVERHVFDISSSKGSSLALSVSAAHPMFGSRFEVVTLGWTASQYLENPWVDHHVLALRYSGGLSGGDLGRRGVFGVGGFPEVPLLDGLINQVILGGVALRGYAPFARVGTQFHLLQAEYRFPIVRIMQGVQTLPIYLNRIHGAVFTDVGDAFFGPIDLSTFLVGVGAELHLDFTVAYVLGYSLRLGFARGLRDEGETQLYFHLGVPF